MALLNDIKKEYKRNLAEQRTTSIAVTNKLGMSHQSASETLGGQIVNKSFIRLYEALGYDIRIEYVRREPEQAEAE